MEQSQGRHDFQEVKHSNRTLLIPFSPPSPRLRKASEDLGAGEETRLAARGTWRRSSGAKRSAFSSSAVRRLSIAP